MPIRWVLHNRILRLLRAGKSHIDPDNSAIHEAFLIDGRRGYIKRGLLLHMRDLTLEDDVARANRYSTDKSMVQRAQGRRASGFRLFFSPPFTFFKFYILKRYFLCGRPGFIYAMMMMFYSFLTEAKSTGPRSMRMAKTADPRAGCPLSRETSRSISRKLLLARSPISAFREAGISIAAPTAASSASISTKWLVPM